jgi:hypothetical protein
LAGLAFWALSESERQVILAPSVGPALTSLEPAPAVITPRSLPFKFKLALPKISGIAPPPKGWSYSFSLKAYHEGKMYPLDGFTKEIPAGPPYELAGTIGSNLLATLLALKGDVFDLRLSVSFCDKPAVECDVTDPRNALSLSWVRLTRAQLAEASIDFGTRAINIVALPKGAGVACAGGQLSGAIEASPNILPLLAATKQVLVLLPAGAGALDAPEVAARTWMKEVSFAGARASFTAVSEKPGGALSGAYSPLLAFCKKGTPDLECVKSSGAWEAKLRSFPFVNRRYLQPLAKNLAPLACGGPAVTLLIGAVAERDVSASFDAIPASVPEEIRATPWAAYCAGCPELTK